MIKDIMRGLGIMFSAAVLPLVLVLPFTGTATADAGHKRAQLPAYSVGGTTLVTVDLAKLPGTNCWFTLEPVDSPDTVNVDSRCAGEANGKQPRYLPVTVDMRELPKVSGSCWFEVSTLSHMPGQIFAANAEPLCKD